MIENNDHDHDLDISNTPLNVKNKGLGLLGALNDKNSSEKNSARLSKTASKLSGSKLSNPSLTEQLKDEYDKLKSNAEYSCTYSKVDKENSDKQLASLKNRKIINNTNSNSNISNNNFKLQNFKDRNINYTSSNQANKIVNQSNLNKNSQCNQTKKNDPHKESCQEIVQYQKFIESRLLSSKINSNSIKKNRTQSEHEALYLVSKGLTEKTAVIDDQKIKKRINDLIDYDPVNQKYLSLEALEIKKLSEKFKRFLLYSDYIIAILNLIIVTTLYFEHFSYIEKFEITDSGNKLRIACIVFSVINCVMICLRFAFKKTYESLKYILNDLDSNFVDLAHSNKIFLVLEVFIHLIQPYPSVQLSWEMLIIGNKVTYTVNMILFLGSMVRLYTLIKALRYWNYYSSEKSIRLMKFYKNEIVNVFLFKVIIKINSHFAIMILFCGILYIFALIFKVLENYDTNEIYYFGNFFNCLWYLISTMTGTGYGDFYPKTLVGRIIGVLCCIIGIFLMSLIVATLGIKIQFNHDEAKVI